MEEEFKVKGKSGVSIEDFASWWYGKRKNVQAIPAEAAQDHFHHRQNVKQRESLKKDSFLSSCMHY